MGHMQTQREIEIEKKGGKVFNGVTLVSRWRICKFHLAFADLSPSVITRSELCTEDSVEDLLGCNYHCMTEKETWPAHNSK